MTDIQMHDTAPTMPGEHPLDSPGARLAAARQEQGWSIEQVASQLKLAPRQVVALEHDNFAALPEMPIVRGFMRSYAKLLKLDPAPLLAQLRGRPEQAAEALKPKGGLSAPFSEARLPSMSEKSGLPFRWVLIALVSVLLVVTFWAFREHIPVLVPGTVGSTSQADILEPLEPLEPLEQPVPAESSEVLPPAQDQALTVHPSLQGGATNSLPPASEPTLALDAATEPPSIAAPTALAESLPAAGGAPAGVPGTPVPGREAKAVPNQLVLEVREESWIDVRPAGGGRTLVSRLAKPGESISVELTGPVELVVGNAAGVDASLRGEPLDLKRSTSTNVARLALK